MGRWFVIGYTAHLQWVPAGQGLTSESHTAHGDRGREGLAMAEEIRAEMVANVWKVVATVGSEVTEGDTLVILESM